MLKKSQHMHFEDKIQDQVSWWGFPATCDVPIQPIILLSQKLQNFIDHEQSPSI